MIDKKGKVVLDGLFVAICYEEGLPFTLFEKPAMLKALWQLNAAYTPPTRRAIGGTLLDNSYTSLKSKVDLHLNSLTKLNIITNESSNINKAHIANISVHTENGTFHLLSEDIGALQSNTINIADWPEQHLLRLTNGDLQRISSLATDTCPTMIAMWQAIRSKPNLKHIIVIPCDSHGIQLLIHDLVDNIPAFTKVHDDAQSLARGFKNAHLQYTRLHEIDMELYGKRYALILSVATRWGTELGLYKSLLRSKEALQLYAVRYPKDLPENLINIICSREFWDNLQNFIVVLMYLDKELRKSEGNNSTIGQILP